MRVTSGAAGLLGGVIGLPERAKLERTALPTASATRLEPRKRRGLRFWPVAGTALDDWRSQLNDQLPTTLEVHGRVGDVKLDLRDTRVAVIRMVGGVCQVLFTLPAKFP